MKKMIQFMMVVVAATCFADNDPDVAQIIQELQAAESSSAVQPIPSEFNQNADDVAGNSRNVRDVSAERQGIEEAGIAVVDRAWGGGMQIRNYVLTDDMISTLKLDDKSKNEEVSDLFSPVSFPSGAYATYWPKLKKLVVLNTPVNFEKIEAIMTSLESATGQSTDQVEIKARFVEFTEGALEELGFNWTELQDGNNASLADNWSVKDGEDLFSDALRSSPDVFTQGSALNAVDPSGRIIDRFSGNAGTLNVSADIGPQVDMLIRALDQTAGIDVLSAPSVVTLAGKEATIEVGQTHYFPETFEGKDRQGAVIHIEYKGFSEKLIGVELAVKPMVKENLIDLELNPKITELLGWRNYQVTAANSSYFMYQFRMGATFEHDPITARLPIFRHRELSSSVTIEDGSTIGMGGLISEKLETFSDRVPVLGSIPLIGRLFRSEGERNVKRNLMIFVTARKISPDGYVADDTTL